MKIADPEHRLFAERVYELNMEAWKETSRVQAEMGRWLLATMVAIHLGATYIVASSNHIPIDIQIRSVTLFVIGLVYILISGLLAWANWGLLAGVYQTYTRPAMLLDTDDWPKDDKSVDWFIGVTYWLSLIFGIGSAICLPVGAWVVISAVP